MTKIEKIVYEYKAIDGEIFNSEKRCLEHEKELLLPIAYTVILIEKGTEMVLDIVGIFSSDELAKRTAQYHYTDDDQAIIIRKFIMDK